MQQQLMFTKEETAIRTWLVNHGIDNAMSGLSWTVGEELRVSCLGLRPFPSRDCRRRRRSPGALGVAIRGYRESGGQSGREGAPHEL